MEWAQRVIAHCEDRAIGYWLRLCSVIAAWGRARMGGAEAPGPVEHLIERYGSAGQRLGLPDLWILLADLHAAGGDPISGLAVTQMAERYIEETGERYDLAGILRSKGELLLAHDPPDGALAQHCFELAVQVARAQDARMLELRATAVLAKFHHRHGGGPETAARLAELCDTFPPSCVVPDLIEARKLVDTLARAEAFTPLTAGDAP
jgi:predicted ATPase